LHKATKIKQTQIKNLKQSGANDNSALIKFKKTKAKTT
jgi:hypothetical protein